MHSEAKQPSAHYLEFAEAFVEQHPEASTGAMFGMRCLKRGAQTFAGGFRGGLVVKLAPEDWQRASALDGVEAFDPSGAGRPMKAWIVLGPELRPVWAEFAAAAYEALQPS